MIGDYDYHAMTTLRNKHRRTRQNTNKHLSLCEGIVAVKFDHLTYIRLEGHNVNSSSKASAKESREI